MPIIEVALGACMVLDGTFVGITLFQNKHSLIPNNNPHTRNLLSQLTNLVPLTNGLPMKIKLIVSFIGVSLLSACSSTGLFLLNNSLKLGAQHSVKKNISYGLDEWQKLDLHIPNTKPDTPMPVLIFFYGGSWDSGNKELYYFIGNAFAKRGYIVVIPNYAIYPDARFPTFMHDGAAATNWVFDHIAKYGGDPNKVVMAGHSAGAHLGGLLLSDDRFLQQYQRKAQDIKAFAGLAGPYNFTPTSKRLLTIFQPASNLDDIKLNTFIDGKEPPMLLLHGKDDRTVGVQNQTALQAELKANNVSVDSKIYSKMGHVKILLSLAPPLTSVTTTLDDIDEFFKSKITD